MNGKDELTDACWPKCLVNFLSAQLCCLDGIELILDLISKRRHCGRSLRVNSLI